MRERADFSGTTEQVKRNHCDEDQTNDAKMLPARCPRRTKKRCGLLAIATRPRSAKNARDKFDRQIADGNTVLNPDFKEFIQSLNDNGVRYLVVGGYAVALHGHPRYTKDLDVWLEMGPENAANLVRALEQLREESQAR